MAIFAQEFGIRPWEWDLLAAREAMALVAAADRIIKQQERSDD